MSKLSIAESIKQDYEEEIENLKESITWWTNRFNAVERDKRELKKEIERLKEELKYTIPIVEHNKTITKHLKEIERLHSIIKEVREYIDKFIKANYEDIFNQEQKDYMIKILEILEGGKDT